VRLSQILRCIIVRRLGQSRRVSPRHKYVYKLQARARVGTANSSLRQNFTSEWQGLYEESSKLCSSSGSAFVSCAPTFHKLMLTQTTFPPFRVLLEPQHYVLYTEPCLGFWLPFTFGHSVVHRHVWSPSPLRLLQIAWLHCTIPGARPLSRGLPIYVLRKSTSRSFSTSGQFLANLVDLKFCARIKRSPKQITQVQSSCNTFARYLLLGPFTTCGTSSTQYPCLYR
jgi:hypothetical protein